VVWIASYVFEISEVAIAVLAACLAGGVVLNVLKQELPEARDSSFTAFAASARGYATLLLVL
jgi:zinc transporter ZupT